MENKFVKAIKNLVLWTMAGMIGVLFYYLYAFAKYQLWSRKTIALPSSVDINSAFQTIIFSIAINFAVAFTSALIPAVACGLLFVITVRKNSTGHSLIAATVYLLLIYRRWLVGSYAGFSNDINVIISYIFSPIVAASVLVVVTIIVQYVFHRSKSMDKVTGLHS